MREFSEDFRFLQRIEEMNQRGGRMLSIVDLLEQKTISFGLAAYLWDRIHRGGSILTCAGPGGVGKTTLLAAILGLKSPETILVPVGAGAEGVHRIESNKPVTYLCHEIGAGAYYGYLWDAKVKPFFNLAGKGHSLAATVHADTMTELKQHLGQPALQVGDETLAKVELIVFIHLIRPLHEPGFCRRVTEVWESDNTQHHLIFQWQPDSDRYGILREGASLEKEETVLQELVEKHVHDFTKVRKSLLSFQESCRGVG